MDLPNRRNHRLVDFDYGSYGYYYVTVCTRDKKSLLSFIPVGSDALVAPGDYAAHIPTKLGEKVIECINNIASLNENVLVDDFVLMPNHIHAVIAIYNTEPVEQMPGLKSQSDEGVAPYKD